MEEMFPLVKGLVCPKHGKEHLGIISGTCLACESEVYLEAWHRALAELNQNTDRTQRDRNAAES